jgi:hypothetical protein
MCFNPSPERRVPSPNRYMAFAKFCFCKNNKRTIIIRTRGRRRACGAARSVLGEQARDGVLGAGGREDVLLVEDHALPEVGDLGAGLGLRGAVRLLGV